MAEEPSQRNHFRSKSYIEPRIPPRRSKTALRQFKPPFLRRPRTALRRPKRPKTAQNVSKAIQDAPKNGPTTPHKLLGEFDPNLYVQIQCRQESRLNVRNCNNLMPFEKNGKSCPGPCPNHPATMLIIREHGCPAFATSLTNYTSSQENCKR